ncbi:hypothetical protein ACFLWG_04070 [Chloroflexota bacterium]
MQTFQRHSKGVRTREFLVTTKDQREVIKIEAQLRKCSMTALVAKLVDTGLKYEEQALKRRINAPILHRPPNFEYIVSRKNKTYISVSNDTYEKVHDYVEKKGLKVVEASWRLLTIGLQYDLGGDPTKDKYFDEFNEIIRKLMNLLQKRGLKISEEYIKDPKAWVIDHMEGRSQHKRQFPPPYGFPPAVVERLNMKCDLYLVMLVHALEKVKVLEEEKRALKTKIAVERPSVKTAEKVTPQQNSDFPQLE